MPTKRIGDLFPNPAWEYTKQISCTDPDHSPNKRRNTPGRYRHTCPSCNKETYFTIDHSNTFHKDSNV